MSDDLLKWVDDPEVFEGIAGALRDAREDLPSDQQIAALATKLGPLLGGGGPGGAGGASGAEGAGGPASGGTGAAGGASTGSVGGGATAAGITGGTKLIVGMLGGAVLIASIASWAVIAERGRTERQADDGQSAVANDVATERADRADATVSTGDALEVPRGLDTPPAAQGAPEVAGGTAPTERRAPLEQTPRPREGTAAADEAPERIPELALLEQAQDALGRAPAESLALADRHARDYPQGALAQEREVVAVDALLRLGRRAAAEARADRFRTANPGSSQLRRIDRLLARE